MPKWLRFVPATAAGFVVWFAVATVGNMSVRWLLPGYVEVEKLVDVPGEGSQEDIGRGWTKGGVTRSHIVGEPGTLLAEEVRAIAARFPIASEVIRGLQNRQMR